MIKHRCTLNLKRAIVLAAALLPLRAAAQSVQVFINTAFVAPQIVAGNPINCTVNGSGPFLFLCPLQAVGAPHGPLDGDISNEPHIEFDANGTQRCNVSPPTAAANTLGVPLLTGTVGHNYCNDRVFMCTQIGVANSAGGAVALDEISFELFKFQDGSNPLDPASTPPLRTFFIDAPGSAGGGGPNTIPSDGINGACVMWDGSANVQGEFGKTNGQYGFRVSVKTNQVGASGNISITATRAYPSGAALDSAGAPVSQKPIAVDVTNVHVVRSSPTVVGTITGVAAQPYNFTYRLSKDATMYISINDALPPFGQLRTVVPGLPKVGEGTPQGTLLNGDSWDGRDNNGNIMAAGNYLAVFQAVSVDQYTKYTGVGADNFGDISLATTRQVAIDPLQITDIRVQPLTGGSTSLAVLSYLLTEAATVYIDVYPPGTQFCPGIGTTLSDVPNVLGDVVGLGNPVKNFGAKIGDCGVTGVPVPPIKSITEIKTLRTQVIGFWDGRDTAGKLVEDGDYVFLIYAALPSQRGAPYRANNFDRRVWTTIAKIGFIPVLRGLVGITQISPTSTVVGSSPAVAGINPFSFRYTLTRDAIVSMKIFDASGINLIKTIVNQETRPGAFSNTELWSDGTDDNGLIVSSGTYLVQLTAIDPAQPSKVSTTTAMFPVDLFRMTDIAVTPLLSGASDNVVLNYQLTQPMFIAWNIYAPGAVIKGTAASWPPCPTQSPPAACTTALADTVRVEIGGLQAQPIVTFRGLRPGRLKISEFWDGRDVNGLFVPDGNYIFTLTAQSTTTPKYFATDRVFGNITVARGSIIFTQFNVLPDSPALFNSSNTITLHPFTINYALTRQSSVTVQILNTSLPSAVIRTIIAGAVRPAGLLQTDVWDGRNDTGNFPPSGFYLVRAVAEDVASVLSSGATAQLTIAFDPLRIYDLAITPLRLDSGPAVLSYQVSETMKVAIKIYKSGTAFDLAGNPTPPEAQSLIKRIVGVRPARTQVNDTWDGTDFKFSLVKDGSYKFKIVGSTDMAAIDDNTGNIINPGALSLDRLIDEIPLVRNASVSPAEDFTNNTFNYPNPVTGESTTFQIYAPFRATVKMKLHTMSGEIVLEKNFGEVPPAFQAGPVTYVWTKINQSGNKVARGLYFAVIRVEETEGGRNILQMVKKVLVQ